ncbi:MAG: hypothetical protein Q9191_005436 [Dirinaria sp. TL-2023a]
MAGRFVRSSKYRHVFGRPTRKEQCYDNIRISKNAWDTNLVKANPKYISVNWEAGGGGAFAVIPLNETGRLPEHVPLFRGHTAVVLDTDWSPFNDSLLASGSEDGKAFIWKVPEGFSTRTEEGEEPKDVASVRKLSGHSRKVGHVLFNPAAENVLATSSGDYSVRVWDVEAGSSRLTLKHAEVIQSLSWSANGSLLVTTSRDKKLRIWDVRQEKPAHVVPGHAGAKNSRVTWMGEHDRIATTGFSKMSDRQLGLWDIRNPSEPSGGFQMLDSISGVCMPFWDDGTQCLYLAGKGDGNIRYFEYEHDKFEYLSEYKSADPQRGIAFLPKRGVNTHENEVMRAFKTVNDSYVEPIAFIVPRRAEVFQEDIYPPTFGIKPAMTAGEWFEGEERLPPKIDLASLYAGEEPAEVPAHYKPTVAADPPPPKASSPIKQAAQPVSEAVPPPSALKGPPPSMKEQTSSIKDLASKYDDQDDDEEDAEDDTSSFEEVSKPIERHAPRSIEKPGGPTASSKGPFPTQPSAPQAQPQVTHLPVTEPTRSPTAGITSTLKSPPPPPTSTSSSSAPGGDPMQGYLKDIKSLLEQQNASMVAQSEKIAALTREVDTLKVALGEKGEKDERIKALEREVQGLKAGGL